jgi:transposase
MEVVHPRCAGMDISKKDAKVCVRIAGAGRRKTTETVTTWGSMTSQILALRDPLVAGRVTCVVLEATTGSRSTTCLRTSPGRRSCWSAPGT